jgi:hypothetical protein
LMAMSVALTISSVLSFAQSYVTSAVYNLHKVAYLGFTLIYYQTCVREKSMNGVTYPPVVLPFSK